MSSILVNEDLFSDSPFFAQRHRLDELIDLFKFSERRILLGEGALANLGDECQRLGTTRVLLVCDPGLDRLAAEVRGALGATRIELVGEYNGVVRNPTVESVDACAGAIAGAGCDVVIALGGGSTLDTAKAAACVATTGASIDAYWGFDLIPEPARYPVIAMPTTAGTGSEASRVSVIADSEGKKAVYSDYLQPRVALVDPLLQRTLPPLLTAVTGLDALGHAFECTASKKSHALGDAVAREAMQAGAAAFVGAIDNGVEDGAARYGMARCALLAGLLLSPINTGAGHALGYGIEKISYERGNPVPHGAAVALVLPGVMRHNAPVVADKYYYAAGVAGLDLKDKSREDGAELAAAWIDDLRRRYTPYTSLRAVGLEEGDIPRMVELAMSVRRLLDPNPVEVFPEDAEAIYRGIFD
ncbi:MAG: iron-containing alcohol dehydrogenase [Candidatus Latescibacterota bacterium]|nr:iron-containing alcohol dehydrogenase [Candidatus Latescibacterota bacterium]MEE2727860.1 iron-containing alcohol dehydrogenase [Candidatus Latescibacterota bacterium]